MVLGGPSIPNTAQFIKRVYSISASGTHLARNAVRDVDVKDVGHVEHGVELKKVFFDKFIIGI